MTLAVIVPLAILLVVYGVLALIALRRPLLGRLAFREAVRRPAHSTLLVMGMMFGTAAVLAMQGVSDSFENIGRLATYYSWGRTDITVTSGGRLFSGAVARQVAAAGPVAQGAAGVEGAFDLVGSVSDLDQRLSAPVVQISTVDPSQARFGSFVLLGGTNADPGLVANGGAVLSSTLAQRVAAKVGDRVQLDFVAGAQNGRLMLRVSGITRAGLSGFVDSGIFLSLDAVQSVVGPDLVNVVKISARGDGLQEVANARALAPAVRSAVAGLHESTNLQVREVKAQDLSTGATQGGSFRIFLFTLSLFIVLAASALVVNLALALAEERRPRLAVLRALGLTRTGMVLVSLIEGALYSLAAGLVGVLPGLAYTYYVDSRPIPGVTGNLFGPGDSFFAVTLGSIALAVCVGTLITLLTLFLVSIRTSRMAISSAIRDLPEPPVRPRRSRVRFAGILTVVAIGVGGWLYGDPTTRMLAGAALILAASVAVRGRISERLRATLGGFAVVLWASLYIVVAPVQALGLGNGAALSFATLSVAVFGAAVAISANLRVVEAAVSLVSGYLVATLRPPLAYLTRRPVRAGLATGAFALVLAALSFFAIAWTALGPDQQTLTGGYDVAVTTFGGQGFTIPDAMKSEVVRAESLRTLAYVGPLNLQNQGEGAQGWQTGFVQLYPMTDIQLSRPPLRLSSRDAQYGTDVAVWQAVRTDPTLVVGTLGNNLAAIQLAGTNGNVRLKVIAIATGVTLGNAAFGSSGGLIGSQRTFTGVVPAGDGDTVLIKTASGVDARRLAQDIRRSSFGQGIDAVATVDLADLYNQQNAWYVGFFTLLLQTGVVVGVLSLGILTLRAAIERRRVIGVLRALGYRPRQVLGGMLVEATVTSTVGIAVGIGTGLAVGFAFLGDQGITQARIDWSQILLPAAAIFVAAWMVTIGPAVRASRMPASEALRTVG
jgi:putative ABC transport system permease protein